MRKLWIFLLCSCLMLAAQADDKQLLQQRLANFESFYANFKQNITSNERTTLGVSEGYIALKKPQLLMMHTTAPDEQVLFTRDNAVYFYDPFVNQVSIYALSQLYDSPFMLLTSNDAAQWQRYKVTKNDDSFELVPQQSSQISKIGLNFNSETLAEIVLYHVDGSINAYLLSEQKNTVDPQLFGYEIPQDAEVDDER